MHGDAKFDGVSRDTPATAKHNRSSGPSTPQVRAPCVPTCSAQDDSIGKLGIRDDSLRKSGM